MLTGLLALENTDWAHLDHAYGRARDTPDHLRALLENDTPKRQKAMSHLWSAIIHQGTPWTATAPVALVVAGFLSDARIDEGESVREGLILFLVGVAEAAELSGLSREELQEMAAFDIAPFLDLEDEEAMYENEEAANSFYARSILGCIEVAPILMQVMLEGLAHDKPRVRMCAAMGTVKLTQIEALKRYAQNLEGRLLALAREARNSDERSAHLLALGELGYPPMAFLHDPSPAVRVCAALAPSLASSPDALEVLKRALEHHANEIDDWFEDRPPQFTTRPRFSIVARLVQQVKEFDALVEAAIAVVNVTSAMCVDFDWGPLMVAAFPDGSGRAMTEAQRRFLRAVVEREPLWNTKIGNASKWFERAGLPYDRAACAERIDVS